MSEPAYIPPMLDRKIVVQRWVSTRDSAGQEINTWQDDSAMWAYIDYTGGTEATTGGKETAISTVVFTVRHTPRLTEKNRIKYDGYFFDIVSITPLGRNHFMTISTTWLR